jgi:cytochrome c oxidase assembly protein subunit 15
VNRLSIVLIVILFIQLIFGSLMAGHKAATAAPTWPAINREWIPDSVFRLKPVLLNFIENKLTIHFIHRSLAYLLILLSVLWTYKALRSFSLSKYFRATRMLPLVIIFIQLLLGILAVLFSTSIIPNQWGIFEWIAELHQVTGMLFMLIIVWMLYIVRPLKTDI